MAGKARKPGAFFLAALIILSLGTIVLLAFAIVFFASAPVGIQMSAWAARFSPETAASFFSHPGPTHPPPQTDPPKTAAPPAVYITPALTPTPTQFADAIFQPAAQQTAPPPTIQVIEKPPPDGSLVIPELGIDHRLVPVPVLGSGWDISGLGDHVGWLQTTGSHPGDDLAMVLIGHVTLPYPGGAGAFLNLRALQIGDHVQCRSGDTSYIYEITTRSIVGPDDVTSLYKIDGNRLLLVTCTGYNALEFKYDLRLIVDAVLVSTEEQGPPVLQ